MPTFGELGVAAYCPRQLYYQRQTDTSPDRAASARALARRYEDILAGTVDESRLDASLETVQDQLVTVRERFPATWPELTNPTETDVLVRGRDATGEVPKVLGTTPPAPTLVTTGEPAPTGVWEPQAVRLTAAAIALAQNRGRSIGRGFVEYPGYGVVREVPVTQRRRATYRRVLRTVERMDGPPRRVDNKAKCDACRYQDECGVQSRSLASLLF